MDRRDRMLNHRSLFTHVDKGNMRATVVFDDDEGYEVEYFVPIMFAVCGTCDGRGRHVNPSIDAHGIGREEFDEDPDFFEDYRNGVYDVDCYECHGANVVPVINEAGADDALKALLARVAEREADDAAYARECEMERRMGA